MWDSDVNFTDHHHAYYEHWADSDAHAHGGPSVHDFAPIHHNAATDRNDDNYGLASKHFRHGAKNDYEEATNKFYGIPGSGFDGVQEMPRTPMAPPSFSHAEADTEVAKSPFGPYLIKNGREEPPYF